MKKLCHKLSFVLFKKCKGEGAEGSEHIGKWNGSSAQMVIVLTTKEMIYLVVGVFDDMLGPLSYIQYICDITFFVCNVCFNLTIA